ncbi:uncharacterized protein F4812DRAFT_62210 [Daldinia caldariorum]|uniref:uncharacterized protein n=1 Tax=Daldinia caldariorum TaxID=326644 RepID=UPI0020083D70|nr:uncharacterized protein F4812DRAFT_62210 [Daldinia caldariorum]KAI1466699.1 hypothetical protein F4812DRAFT_62210 [Daldinia caldariorum]
MADVNHSWDNANFVPVLGEDIPGITSACERLGDLLGIHEETCKEVKEHVATNYECAVLESLGITIGFPRQGITQYLGSRPGGQRFLALVCALGTAFDPPESAQVVASLMGSHLKLGAMPRPTAEKLCPLLDTVKAQCNLSNFANLVADYEITLTRELRKRRLGPAACSGRLDKTPDTDAVTKLAQLLLSNKSAESGERRPKAITIQAGSCVPWLVAFLRWWLRKTPVVYLGEGQPASQQQCEKIIQGDTSIGIKLGFPATQKDGSAPELVRVRAVYSPSHWEDWTFRHGRAERRYGGLVSIPTYFRLMLNAFRLDQGQANQAAVEVIPYALSEARKSLTMCSEGCVSRGRWGVPCATTTDLAGAKSKLWLQSQEEKEKEKEGEEGHNKEAVLASELAKIRSGRFEPFPERAEINSILRLVGGCEGKHMQDLRSKQMGLPIYGHKEAAAFLGQAKHESEREAWMAGGLFRSQLPLGQPGATTVFVEQMAHVVATILALSLFRNPEPRQQQQQQQRLMVRPDPLVWQSAEVAPSTVISAICRVFRGQTACSDVTEWHRVCRKLAGESEEGRPEIERRNVIISGGAGQAVWPATIVGAEKLPASDESYLRLRWCRGKIFNSQVQRSYRSVVAANSHVTPDWALSQSATATATGTMTMTMTAAAGRQLAENTRYVFNSVFHPQSNQVLECSMVRTLEYEGNKITSAALDPTGVIKALASAERIESCPHDEKASVDMDSTTTNARGHDGTIVPDMYLCTPENPLPWLRDWARRADDEQVARQGLSELLQRVRSMGGGPASGAVAVIPTAGDDRLRIFTLSKPVGAHVAIRGHACLACCVKFCKHFGFSVLVL